MRRGIAFIGGVYGVGKSTLCSRVSKSENIPFYSAGDLISAFNGEQYGVNKKVLDVGKNQRILIDSIEQRLMLGNFMLAGHMCIFNKNNEIEVILEKDFRDMHVQSFVLLEAPIDIIARNLYNRDELHYPEEILEELIDLERKRMTEVAKNLNVPFHIVNMTFSPLDEVKLIEYLKEDGII